MVKNSRTIDATAQNYQAESVAEKSKSKKTKITGHQCEQCKKSFTRTSGLKLHLSTVHDKERILNVNFVENHLARDQIFCNMLQMFIGNMNATIVEGDLAKELLFYTILLVFIIPKKILKSLQKKKRNHWQKFVACNVIKLSVQRKP